jgi:hypothetical protein
MFTSLRSRLAGIWVFSVAVLAACSVVLGLAVTASAALLWLLVCIVPRSHAHGLAQRTSIAVAAFRRRPFEAGRE